MILGNAAKRLYHRYESNWQRKKELQPGRHVEQINREMAADRRRQGFSFWDSFCYDLRYNDYRDYISTWEGWQPARSRSPYFKISADKYLFACVFGPYIKVPVTYALIENGKLVMFDGRGRDLYGWLLECGGAVIKDRYGCNGYNIAVLCAKEDGLYHQGRRLSAQDLADLTGNLSGGIIQEKFCQGEFEDHIFNGSINTIRVISAQKTGGVEHEVIGAVHRFGTKQSAPVDNFHQGGVSAPVDIETGRLGKLASMFDTDGMGKHIFHERHPDTGIQVEGLLIPGWEQLKGQVVELTRRLPFFEFLAWDFVLLDDGFALIEINKKTTLDLFQVHGGARRTLIGEKYREHGYLVEKWDRRV